MSLQFIKASTSDALTLNEISKRAFDSDVLAGAPSTGGPPGYMSVPFHLKMARSNHLFKLVDNGLIIGGAVLFFDNEYGTFKSRTHCIVKRKIDYNMALFVYRVNLF